MQKLNKTRPVISLETLVQNLALLETVNICVQTSIAGIASRVDPVRWSFLIADGADAARRAGDDDLEDLFESILELVEKP